MDVILQVKSESSRLIPQNIQSLKHTFFCRQFPFKFYYINKIKRAHERTDHVLMTACQHQTDEYKDFFSPPTCTVVFELKVLTKLKAQLEYIILKVGTKSQFTEISL